MSKIEQKLLHILVKNPGATLTRERLIDYVWSYCREYVDENVLSVTIKRLRDKLEDEPSRPKHIRTVYEMGMYGR
ncbi:MAG: winged helix-turn-helix domain-containing protein [Clostridiales bacterium]|nr:winged helix-turn-helix domain-containing protein [Clostridiales bacterium]